jgi:hypothetical protein
MTTPKRKSDPADADSVPSGRQRRAEADPAAAATDDNVAADPAPEAKAVKPVRRLVGEGTDNLAARSDALDRRRRRIDP